ncbi:MAG: peptidase domain-containing ABC transporter [Gammaproteobacteria bacterium]|nr:peptidase domain-containing ABC transporter [Gammaproteobacteria bacterium]
MIDIFQSRNALPMIFQTEIAECGLACLAMVANYHGKFSDIRTLRESLCMPPGGASVKHLLQAALQLDLRGRPLKLDLSDIAQLTLPVILHWDTDHFVVLKKVTRKSFVIHDPAMGIRKYSLPELDRHFTGIAIELSPTVSFTRERQGKEYSLKELFKVTPSFRRAIRQVFFLSLLLQVLSLVFPLYLQLVIDQGLSKGDMDIIFLVALLFSLVILAKASVAYFRGVVLLQFSSQLGFQMISNTFAHLLRLPLSYFEKREMGDIVSRFSSLDNIKQLVTQEMITVIVDGLFSLLTFFLLFLYSPTLAFVALLFVVALSLIRLLAIPREKSYRQEVLQSGAKQQTRFMENIRCIAVIKSYGIESERLLEWQNYYAYFIRSSYRLGHLQLSLTTLHSLLFGIDHVVTIYLGSAAIFSGQLTIGQLMSFIFLKQNFSGSVAAMLPKLAEIKLLRLELDRVSDIVFEEPELNFQDTNLLKLGISGAIEAEGLGFSYSTAQAELFGNLNFSIVAGEFCAISGYSGCGKSTLLKLLLCLAAPSTGVIRVDGHTIPELGVSHYRSQVVAVLHGDGLLSGSLAYNVHLETEPLNLKRLEAACRICCIFDDISQLPMGFNTQVGEMGVALSAGQVQRVLLARALYRHPKIVVLDEALSHLSTNVARKIIAGIRDSKTTLILVTHNPDLISLADYSLVLGEQNSGQAVPREVRRDI